MFPYLDNVAGRTQEEHDANVKLYLDATDRNNFTLNEFKTITCVKSVQILGYVVEKGVIKPDPERLRSLKDFLPPSNSKQLKAFWRCSRISRSELIDLQIKFVPWQALKFFLLTAIPLI